MPETVKHKKKVTTSKEDYLKAIWTLSERGAEQKSEAGTRDFASLFRQTNAVIRRMSDQRLPLHLLQHTGNGGRTNA